MDAEKHYRDMQDIEFTVQQSKLYVLQRTERQTTGAGGAERSPSI